MTAPRLRPPRVAAWLIANVCDPEDRHFVTGDLEDDFCERASKDGVGPARWAYRVQVARSLLPCAARRVERAVAGGPRGVFGDLAGDARYAFRRLLGTPVQVIVTVASLSIGIGVATTVFSVGNAFLFAAPGGLTDTEGLVAIYTSDESGALYRPTSFPDFEDIAKDPAFSGAAAVRPGVVGWERGDVSERLMIEMVSGNYFDLFDVRLPLGRGFAPEEGIAGRAAQVAVISYDLWQTEFSSNPGVLGEVVRIHGRDYVVIGVAPKGLVGLFLRMKVDMWVPLGPPGGLYHQTPDELLDRGDREYGVYARLVEGVPMSRAQGSLEVLASRLREEYDAVWEDDRAQARSFTVIDAKDSLIPPDGRMELAGFVVFMLAGAGLILLIACANVAGLFIVRARQRGREIAVRLSLGAGRVRIVRMLLVEALMLAVIGGSLGVWMASTAAAFMGAIPLPVDVPLNFAIDLDWRVMTFAVGTSVMACLMFGLVPAMQSVRPDLVKALKGDRITVGTGRSRVSLKSGLVVFQVAASFVLLVGAGLSLRSAQALGGSDWNLDPSGIALISQTLREVVDEDALRLQHLEVAEKLAARPEVASVSIGSIPELSPWVGAAGALLSVDGYEPTEAETMVVSYNAVTPNHFGLLGMRPVRGRVLEAGDVRGAETVAVVNETFARRFWSGADPIGKRFTALGKRRFDSPYPAPERIYTVVGVLPDVRVSPEAEALPFYWSSFDQDPTQIAVFHVQARSDPALLVPVLREILPDDGKTVRLVPPQTYTDLISFLMLPVNLAARVLGAAGAFALLLAVMGIYGVISFAVSERTREMAIRLAIGAGGSEVLSTVFKDGMRLATLGVVFGLVVSIPGAVLAKSALLGVSPLDVPALGGTTVTLLFAAAVATFVPALRATRVDPMKILREE